MNLITTATSADEAHRAARVAVLPVGSFEQHGAHLPLITDTVVACAIAEGIARAYNVLQLPPITVSCSHEHTGWSGTVTISSRTLIAVIGDIAGSLRRSGVERLVIVNGHGGNYVLSNVVQEANVDGPRMALFPARADWDRARRDTNLVSNAHDDMHAGEIETSLMLHVWPDLVGDNYEDVDHTTERPHLLLLGLRAYTTSGVLGQPSLASAEKGKTVLDSLVASFADTLAVLVGDLPPSTSAARHGDASSGGGRQS